MKPDGIFFRMPEEEYLAEERLSKSGIKRLRVSPADYWHESHLNPNPPKLTPEQEEKRALARLIGRAYHCARLEPDRYAETYVRKITPADFNGVDGFLSNATGIEAELAARERPKKFKDDRGVIDQARRLKAAGYEPPIWHLEEDAWKLSLKPGQIVIPANAFDEIAVDMGRLALVPAIHERLSGGFAEVSVFWTCPASGIPMKARFDYLRSDGWTELKTFANVGGKSLYQAITDAVRFNRYYIDAVSYRDTAEIVRGGGVDIIGDATDDEINLITAIQERRDELDCHFVFIQKGGAPNILERSFRFWQLTDCEDAIAELEELGASEEHLARARRMQEISDANPVRTAIHAKGRMEIAAAKDLFLAYSEIYEPGQPWMPFNPSGEISDLDFSSYFLEEPI